MRSLLLTYKELFLFHYLHQESFFHLYEEIHFLLLFQDYHYKNHGLLTPLLHRPYPYELGE